MDKRPERILREGRLSPRCHRIPQTCMARRSTARHLEGLITEPLSDTRGVLPGRFGIVGSATIPFSFSC